MCPLVTVYVSVVVVDSCNPVFADRAQAFRNYFTAEQSCFPSRDEATADPFSALYYIPRVSYCRTDKVRGPPLEEES